MKSIRLRTVGIAGFTFIMLTVQQVAGSQGTPGGPAAPVAELVVTTYSGGDDGLSRRAGISTGTTATGFSWASAGSCNVSSGDSEPATAPDVGWKHSIRVISRADGQLTVFLSWSRAWDKGVRTDGGAMGAGQRVLKIGERAVIDVIEVGPSAKCGVTRVQLEISAKSTSAAVK